MNDTWGEVKVDELNGDDWLGVEPIKDDPKKVDPINEL